MEVLVALALVSLLAGVLLQVMTVGLRAQKSSQLSAQALEVAGNVLQEFTREGGRRLVQGRRIGQDGNFTYQVTVEPQYQVAVPPPMNTRVTCFLVRVTVSWQERGRTRSLGLTTMRTVSQKPA
jgi:type II secretory pathway pseudopilin PulG